MEGTSKRKRQIYIKAGASHAAGRATPEGSPSGAPLRIISYSRAHRKSCCSPMTLPGRTIRSHPIASRAVNPWCFIM